MSTRRREILLWIVCLAFLSVGARNFEDGLGHDGPIYSTVARNIALGGGAFRLNSNLPDFSPYFAEHPHLGFWVQSLFLRLLPDKDWVVRILGHLLYVFFLYFFYLYIRSKSSEKVATWTILWLWTFHLFSNVFSTFYLDPGVLCLGTLAVLAYERGTLGRLAYFLGAGVLMGLAAMYKGLTVLGFLPSLLWLSLYGSRRKVHSTSHQVTGGVIFFAGAALVLGAYAYAVAHSDFPTFFDIYWERQVTHRFGQRFSLWNLLSKEYWVRVLQYTNWFGFLALLTLRDLKRKPQFVLAWILILTFVCQFGGSGLTGGQYLIMFLPWMAWLMAEVIHAYVPISAEKLRRVSMAVALGGVCLIQYLPFRTHGVGILSDHPIIRYHSDRGDFHRLFLDLSPAEMVFVNSGSFAWYGKVDILYPNLAQLPLAKPDHGYYVRHPNPEKQNSLRKLDWCLVPGTTEGQLYLPCPR